MKVILRWIIGGLIFYKENVLAFLPTPRATATVSSTTLFGKSLEPLAFEGEWTAFLDEENTGLVYYFNRKTGESLWEPPTDTFPPIELKGGMRRRARLKQEEYVKAAAMQEQAESKKGIFSELLEGDKEALPTAVNGEGEREEEPAWFSKLFEEVVVKPTTAEKETEVEKEDDRSGGFFNNLLAVLPMNGQDFEVVEEEPSSLEDAAPASLKMASHVLPHPEKALWGGEDAVFTKGRTFGVFDGVSSAEKKIGVPLYSKMMAKQLQNNFGEEGVDVKTITKIMTEAAKIADESATGATTAIVGSVSEDGFLRVLNLGDSACIVIRDGKVVGKTREISHYFDCPYQLSVDSPDRPKDGTKFNIELLPGDMILAASDGIFDNIADQEIAEIVHNGPKQLLAIAKRVVEKSRKVSTDSKANTPYAKQAQKYGDPDYADGVGGKVDDACCIIVRYG